MVLSVDHLQREADKASSELGKARASMERVTMALEGRCDDMARQMWVLLIPDSSWTRLVRSRACMCVSVCVCARACVHKKGGPNRQGS